MSDAKPSLFRSDARSEWVRLRTLILLRWLAVGGQTLALLIAHFSVDLNVPLGLCFLGVGASVIVNLVAMTIYPENKRLTEREAMLTLLFDLAQLAYLLFLTGGLNNPFALLILAPVTISATALRLRSTLILGITAILLITLIAFFHLPLRMANGQVMSIPDVFVAGFWMAITIGILFLSAYARRVTQEVHIMSQALLATQMALSREQKLTDLGGVIAAAAHELGTPLATIKLASSELVEELSDRPELRNDAVLIREQTDRCRDILRSMGRAGKDDLHLRTAPLAAVIREAAEPHQGRGKALHFDIAPANAQSGEQPVIRRQPEIIHGLRNLVQNAVDFAGANVWIDAHWTASTVTLRVVDDGPGYPPDLLGRIGDPFVRRRAPAPQDDQRPAYEGMGLGLFIAKTLLERSGAEVVFANASDPFLSAKEAPDRSGAIVEVTWPLSAIAPMSAKGPLGQNVPIEI